jgi:hypothetical protein
MLLSCTGSPLAGGSGTGVGNGTVLIGKVLSNDSIPVENALVRLRTDMYLADTSGRIANHKNDTAATTFTNRYGMFTIDSVRLRKNYYIEILDTNEGHDSGALYKVDLSQDTLSDTIWLPPRTMQPLKNLKGSIILNGLPRNAYIQIYGLERTGRADSNGSFRIEQLPPPVDCEGFECEYKLRITVLMHENAVQVYNSELEVHFDSNQNIIDVEFELEDDHEDDHED